jgi:hypothetical protein
VLAALAPADQKKLDTMLRQLLRAVDRSDLLNTPTSSESGRNARADRRGHRHERAGVRTYVGSVPAPIRAALNTTKLPSEALRILVRSWATTIAQRWSRLASHPLATWIRTGSRYSQPSPTRSRSQNYYPPPRHGSADPETAPVSVRTTSWCLSVGTTRSCGCSLTIKRASPPSATRLARTTSAGSRATSLSRSRIRRRFGGTKIGGAGTTP